MKRFAICVVIVGVWGMMVPAAEAYRRVVCPGGWSKEYTHRFHKGPKQRLLISRGHTIRTRVFGRPSRNTCIKIKKPTRERGGVTCAAGGKLEPLEIFSHRYTIGKYSKFSVKIRRKRFICFQSRRPIIKQITCPSGYLNERIGVFYPGPRKRLVQFTYDSFCKKPKGIDCGRTCLKITPPVRRHGGVICPAGGKLEPIEIIYKSPRRRLVKFKFKIRKKKQMCLDVRGPSLR